MCLTKGARVCSSKKTITVLMDRIYISQRMHWPWLCSVFQHWVRLFRDTFRFMLLFQNVMFTSVQKRKTWVCTTFISRSLSGTHSGKNILQMTGPLTSEIQCNCFNGRDTSVYTNFFVKETPIQLLNRSCVGENVKTYRWKSLNRRKRLYASLRNERWKSVTCHWQFTNHAYGSKTITKRL